MDPAGLDPSVKDAFRGAMRRFASTVSIITVESGTERHGTTATAVSSLSFDPPSLLVCINQDSRLHEYLTREARFCINVLHKDNVPAARAFSMPLSSAERFTHGDWRSGEFGAPYLADAQANLFCAKENEIRYGSHTIFIGRVLHVRLRGDVAPLLYRDGAYACSIDLDSMLG
jgi:flavin reductase